VGAVAAGRVLAADRVFRGADFFGMVTAYHTRRNQPRRYMTYAITNITPVYASA
jgi:hypothetical protein